MTYTAVVIRHVLFEDLGILQPMLTARGYRITYLEAGIDPIGDDRLLDADLVIVLGGPIGLGDVDRYPFLDDEVRTIAARIGTGRPILGICLGAQLIAAALGAEVTPTGKFEVGYGPLTLTPLGEQSLLAPLSGIPVLHWHGDEFAIPATAGRLAETPGFPNQAFISGQNLLALQFHLEADHTMLERWLIGHAHELAANRIDPRTIREQARLHGPTLATRSRSVFATWLDALDN